MIYFYQVLRGIAFNKQFHPFVAASVETAIVTSTAKSMVSSSGCVSVLFRSADLTPLWYDRIKRPVSKSATFLLAIIVGRLYTYRSLAMASLLTAINLFSGSITSIAQAKMEVFKRQAPREFISASPGASMFTVFEQTPVSHFTGAPRITVPLHTISYKELSVDLSLKYHSTMGNKPEVLPGPVGNGWLITSGGTITRISKGVQSAQIGGGPSVPSDSNPTEPLDWSSATTMNTHLRDLTVFVGAECRFDEYAYNFLGMSGKFYKDHNNVPHFKSDDGENLTVETFFQPFKSISLPLVPQGPTNSYTETTPYRASLTQYDYIEKFVVTDSKGIKYVFGGTENALEYSKPGLNALTFGYDLNTVPATWYLTSIESPNGYAITFQYRRGQFYVTSETACEGMTMVHSQIATGLFRQPFPRSITSTVIHPSYLESITTPNALIQFSWSLASTQLQYRYNPTPGQTNSTWPKSSIDWPMYFQRYLDIHDAYMTNRMPDKLDKIEIRVNGQLKKHIAFGYTSDPATRLKLLSAKIADVSATDKGHDVWEFQYNQTPLPEYLSFKTDKYGYYNGRNDYIISDNVTDYINLFSNPTTLNSYVASRAPDPLYSQSEILTKVINPSKGYTVYEYENNDYGRKAIFWPIGILENSSVGESRITGGLRIRKVKTYDLNGSKASEKEYFYALNYATGGRKSSGVLNYDPVFYESFTGEVVAPANKYASASLYEGELTYKRWNIDGLYPPSYYKGSHVKYSEVAEVDLDGSYTVYKHANYDNGYHDKPAENVVCDNQNIAAFQQGDDLNNMELERGKLLSKEMYTNTNQIVRKVEFFYNDDELRFDKHVRIIKGIANPIYSANFPSVRYIATKQYTYYSYLKRKKQTEYSGAGTSVHEENYIVDGTKRLLKEQSLTLNNNKKRRYIYRYTDDMISAGQTVPYVAMRNKHMLSTLIESEERLDNTLLQTKSVLYATGLSQNENIIAPAATQTRFKSETPETEITYHRYDHTGAPLYLSEQGTNKVCYIWSYKHVYPIAKIVNAEYDLVKDILGQTEIEDFAEQVAPTLAQVNAFLVDLRGDSRLSQARIFSYSYDPLFGVTSETDSNGRTTYYEYDHLGRLQLIRDNDRNVLKVICYDYAGQLVDCVVKRETTAVNFYYAATKQAVCGIASNPQSIQNVSSYYAAAIPGLYPVGQYYQNHQLTTLLPTGYYVRTSENINGNYFYSFVVAGEVIFSTRCSNGIVPFVAGYKATLPPTTPCATSNVIKAIYTSNTPTQINLAVGVQCFSNELLTNAVADGYYFYGDNYYRIVNGQVLTVTSCIPVQTHSIMLASASSSSTVCGGFRGTEVFYQGTLVIGTVLYLDSVLSETAPGPRYYSDASKRYTVNAAGAITALSPCQ